MAHILVHVTHGPEHPTRSALGFLVGKAAIEEGRARLTDIVHSERW
jgi:hypothetical protein